MKFIENNFSPRSRRSSATKSIAMLHFSKVASASQQKQLLEPNRFQITS
jgi:hypothetical protein